eukprot:TRINITY_DN2834_c0_g2_i1.p1 TRINITY_DN2834_c0_g2~~TRINITY_DN2834_c0_g2_i1.p1  ORF type:complete len:189 (+),score=37.82 TRINITY_DN2834_c0_g2_i1:3-569(+)
MSDDESDDFRSSSDDDSDYEETTLGKRSGKKGIAGALKKRKGTRSNFDSDDSDDDDSGSESEEEEFSFEYGPDGYKDQEDYMALMKKPEFERESILAERLEKRSAAEDLFMKKKKLREQKRAVRKLKFHIPHSGLHMIQSLYFGRLLSTGAIRPQSTSTTLLFLTLVCCCYACLFVSGFRFFFTFANT